MKTFKLNPALIMSKTDLTNYQALPDNLPDTHLTAKQIEIVRDIYYRYITRNIDHASYGVALYELELKEKWPSGPRVKQHEAKRMVIEQLVNINRRKNLKPTEAANYFLTWLDGREYVQKLIKSAYNA